MANEKNKSWIVYVHISPSNKYYVGITSQDAKQRWKHGKGYSPKTYFCHAIQKYGWDAFQHEIIASGLNEDEAKNFEKLLISKLQSNEEKYGYNLTEGGDGSLGLHPSDETKLAMSIAKGCPVVQLDMDLNIIAEFHSANYAAKMTGIWESMILGCCHKKTGYKTAGGYVWMYKDDYASFNKNEYLKRLAHEKLPKPVCKFSLSMEFLEEYKSVAEAGNSNDIAPSSISNAANGRSIQSCGYIWIFKDDVEKMRRGEISTKSPYRTPCGKSVFQYTLAGTFVKEFESRKAAADSIGVTPQAIGYACRSKGNRCKGYMWKYQKEVA